MCIFKICLHVLVPGFTPVVLCLAVGRALAVLPAPAGCWHRDGAALRHDEYDALPRT